MSWLAILNIILPEVFTFIKQQKSTTNPATGQPWTYLEILQASGIQLDAEHAQLMADMFQDLAEGAV